MTTSSIYTLWHKLRPPLQRGWRRFLMGCGLLLLMQLALPVTGLQGHWKSWLAASNYELQDEPDYIVVLGGGGIPSKSGFIRTWHGGVAAQIYTNATVIVALPADGDPEESSVGRMKQILIQQHGIAPSRIRMETQGLNTYEQAVHVRQMLGEQADTQSILVVTSPYHLRRSVLCFKKTGFDQVGVLAAASIGAEADFGRWMFLRYGLWQALSDQPTYAREMIAIATYRLRGWI